MARSLRHGLIAGALLSVAEVLSLLLAAPAVTMVLPPVHSRSVPGWRPGAIVLGGGTANTVRLIQDYVSDATGDTAAVETRCTADAKGFLNWSGKLGYAGAGYGEVRTTTTGVSYARPTGAGPEAGVTQTGVASDAVMQNPQQTAVIVYAYVDHWGVHAESAALWPRAFVDLVTRHPGPYCMLGVSVGVTRTQQQARAEGQDLLQAFLPPVAGAIR
jgi:hypothetical protein